MKNNSGIIGYGLVIFGAILIDTPMIAVLAIPIFLAGVILLAITYDKILQKYSKLGMLGIIIICVVLAYTAIEFNQYLVLLSREENEAISSLAWIKIALIIALNLIASYFVFLGFKQDYKLNKSISTLGWWLPTVLLVPVVLLWKLIAYWRGFWLGG